MEHTADRPPVLLFLVWFCGLLGVALGLVLLATAFEPQAAQARERVEPGLAAAQPPAHSTVDRQTGTAAPHQGQR